MVVEPVGSQVVALLLCSKHLASTSLPCQDSANANTENTPNNTKNLALLFIFGPSLGIGNYSPRMMEHPVLQTRVFNELCCLASRFTPALGKKYTVLSGKKDRGCSGSDANCADSVVLFIRTYIYT